MRLDFALSSSALCLFEAFISKEEVGMEKRIEVLDGGIDKKMIACGTCCTPKSPAAK